VQILSDLNYKIMDKKGKLYVVNINRLKKSYNQTPWSFENARVLIGGSWSTTLTKYLEEVVETS